MTREADTAHPTREDSGGGSRPLDLLAIGETMALVTPARPEPLEDARDFHVGSGGAESNVACHLAAAGCRVEWFSALDDDPLGRRVRAFIEASSVSVGRVRLDAGAPTGLYVKDPGAGVSYYRRGSAASRLGPEDLAGIDAEQARIVHLTGITPALSESCRALVDAAIDRAHDAGTLVSFDVNHRPALWASTEKAARTILALARRADIVFVGRDEAETLWGARTADAVRELLPEAPHLVVKDADVEAVEFSADGRTAVPTPRVEVVEAVGAGDAFAAGWLDGLLEGASPRSRLGRGHQWAARALSSTQDIPDHGDHADRHGSSAPDMQEATA
ncbi:sugar kinase [Brachybacterium sp. MASK1Z-5]|uniref:Sugar kinase n=1 Tax=Brachybacterium halotolerans TaxID=2795215 RepID=A0ABS1BA53_9MICO|nr:sugar kinase [Brachybacterium halotolerans]MBK0331503.1 sugar kinase [Brachybacterium halotolerans]